MKYLSVCSGIEAASVAWHPLGWTPVAFSEIDKFPSAVLAHHYPTVTASRCLGLIERNAARMMRAGGGGIAREAAGQIHAHRITADKKARALELGKTGLYSATEIAAMVGSTQPTVAKLLERAGVKTKDGRGKKRAPSA